jgi:hypothetical protein
VRYDIEPMFALRLVPLIALAVFLSRDVLAEQDRGTGWIRVRSSPGVRIFVDGKFRGVTDEHLRGLVIDKVSPGTHLVLAEQKGFAPVEALVQVHANVVSEIEAQPYELALPDLEASEQAPKQGGTGGLGGLIIQSMPEKISIVAPALGAAKLEKTGEEWSLELAEGSYPLTFIAPGGQAQLTHVAKIREGRDLYLMVDFPEGRVIELRALGREPGGAHLDQREACILGSPSASQSWPTPGWLTIDARPAATVYQESRKLGETPVAHVLLPAGCVRLRFVELGTGHRYERSVWVEPNQDLPYRCTMEQETCYRP